MINRFFKTIHNKYSRFFKFIFFLRYLFVIFFISISLFLTIPIFFNYEKKVELIKNYLIKNYNFEISEYEDIRYKAFPFPRLEIKKVQINFIKSDTNLNINKLKIYPKILNIYEFNNFQVSKIILNKNTANIEISNFPIFLEQLLSQKKKISLDNLNLKILNDNKLVLELVNVFFSNFGYKKNLINGKVFGKNFIAELGENPKSVKFKILNSGISSDIYLDEKKKTGVFKSKILNTNLKFNFEYDNQKLKIFNSYFRNKSLSFNNQSLITFVPFFDIKTNLEIEELNYKIFKKINFIKFMELKDSIKKINSKNTITYKPKNFSKGMIDNLNLQIDLVYGRVYYKKKFLFTNNLFECEGSLNIFEEYPLLYFDCFMLINNKKKLLKKFSINLKNNKDILRIKAKGNINILNKKINFDKILLNEKNSSDEDLKHFKNSFENILFDKSFLEIFDLKKIKNYILEII